MVRRHHTRLARVGVLGAVLLGSAGCGSARSAATVTRSSPSIRLSILYRPHGAYPLRGQADPTERWTLTCWPPGGTHPARHAACTEVARHGSELYGGGVSCQVIVRGAPSAVVTGVIGSHRIQFVASTCSPAWRNLRALLTGAR